MEGERMRKTLLAMAFGVVALCAVSLVGLAAYDLMVLGVD